MRWLIRAPLGKGPAIRILVRGRQRPRIAAGDEAILFRSSGLGVEFWASGTVRSVVTEQTPEEEPAQTTLTVDNVVPYDDPRPLEWFRFSLHRVYRYYRSHVHFRRTYLVLNEVDFETIHSDNPAALPTVVGMLLEELDRSEVTDLLRDALARSHQLTLGLLLTALEDRLHIQYAEPLNLLNAATEVATRLFPPDDVTRMRCDQEDGHGTIAHEELRSRLKAVVDAIVANAPNASVFELARQAEDGSWLPSGLSEEDIAWRLLVERLSSAD